MGTVESKSRIALKAAHAAIQNELDKQAKYDEERHSRHNVFCAVDRAYEAVREVLGAPNRRIDEVQIVATALWCHVEDVDVAEVHPDSVAGSWFEAFYRATLRSRNVPDMGSRITSQ